MLRKESGRDVRLQRLIRESAGVSELVVNDVGHRGNARGGSPLKEGFILAVKGVAVICARSGARSGAKDASRHSPAREGFQVSILGRSLVQVESAAKRATD